MRVTEKMKKLLSILLCLCMLVQNCPVMAFAATTDNLCDHHTEHTAECGYREGSAGSACTHKHSEGCYKIVACKHTHDDTCRSGCSHTCTVENGCITMELDCHHTHGDCGYAAAVEPQDCTTCQSVLTHAENCGYVAPVAEVTCACVPGEDGILVHTEGCGYVAPVAEVKCACEPTVTHGGEGCTYVEGKSGSPCTHTHAVKVDSAESCYKLLCSHKDGGHDDACGYAASVSGSVCTYHCHICHVQELVDALPGEVTAENAEAVAAQLTAIDNEKASLSDEELAQVDFAKYTTAAEGLGSVYAAVPAVDPTCNCETKCAEDSVNSGCAVCGAVGADLSVCTGTETTASGVDDWCVVNTEAGTVTIDGTLGGKTTATEEDINALLEAIKGYVDSGITTIIVTGGNPAVIEVSGIVMPAVSEAIYRLTGSGNYDENNPYNGKIDLILSDVKEILEWEFYQAYALNSITLPKVTTIGDQAFQVCYYLKQITFGSVVTSIVQKNGLTFAVGEKVDGCDLVLNCGQLQTESTYKPDLENNVWFKPNWGGDVTWKSITLTHTEETAATCTAKATCSVCGDPYGEVDADAHSYGDWVSNGDNTHTRTCANDPSHTEDGDCSGGTATCKELAVCDICKTAYGALSAHTAEPTYAPNAGDSTQHDVTYPCCNTTATEVHTMNVTTGKCVCGATMTVVATVTDGTNTYYAADAATLNQAVTAILETGSRTFTVELRSDAPAEMITAIRRAICDTEGVTDGSIHLTLKGVTTIPGTTNWDGVAFCLRYIYDEAGNIIDDECVTQLASVNLPDVTEIGALAFYYCENLVSVSAPKAQTIGAQALGYTALTSVEFPELTTIPTDMFSGTWTLSSAKFPKVTTIEEGGLLIGAKFKPENNPTPFPLELTAEGDITFNGSYHFNVVSQNYSGKVDLVLCCDKKDAVTFHDDGTATWQVRDDLSYTFKSITFKHSYVDGKCKFCKEDCTHIGGTATCTTQAVCTVCGESYGELGDHSTTAEGDRAATCTAPAYCSVCKSEYGELDPTNHASEKYTYTDNGDGTHTKTHECGVTVGEPENHTIENHVCTGCGAMEITVSFNAGDYKWETGDQINFVREVEGIGVDDCVFTATVAEDGTVTWSADKPFCWYGEGEQKLFAAPQNGWSVDYFVIPEDQSTSEKLDEADLVNGMWVGTPTTDTITFNMTHRMAKVTVNYEFAEGVTADISELKVYSIAQICLFSIDDWSIKLTSAGQYDAWVTPYLNGNQFTAFIIPETYATGEDFIKITLSDGTVYEVKMNKAVTFEDGGEYNYKVVITADGAYLTCADECSFEYTDNGDGTHSYKCITCGYEVASENHTATYSASGNVITAACSANCGYSETATITAVNATYSGTAQETATIAYSEGWKGGELTVSYENNTNAGTANASITAGEATATVDFTIAKATVTVTADAKTKTYGTDNPELTYRASGLFGSDTLTGALATTATKTSNVGAYDITVGSLGSSNYTIDFVGAKLTITKAAAPEIQWPTAAALTYGQKLSDSALTSEDENGTFAWQDGNTVPTVTNNGYVVVYTPKETHNYDYSSVELTKTISVIVSKVSATVTAAPTPQTLTYSGEAQNLINGGTASGGTMVYSLSQNGAYTISIPQGTNAGEYTVWYYVEGDNNHSDSAKASLDVTIGKKTLTAALSGSVTKVYDGTKNVPATHNLRIHLTGLVGSDDVSTTASFVYDGAGVGTTRILASGIALQGADAGNYKLKNTVISADVGEITKADVTVTAPKAVDGLIYNGKAQTLIRAGTATGGTMQYRLSQNESYSTTIPTGTNAGTYTVYYKVAGDTNHNDAAAATVTVTIAKAAATAAEIPVQKHFHDYATANTLALSQYLPADRGETTYTLGTITGNFFADGTAVTETGSLTYSTRVVDAAATGSIAVKVVMENYGDVTLTVPVELVAVNAQVEKRIVKNGLTEVPAGLANTGFNTVEKIKAEQQRVLGLLLGQDPQGNIAHYDVKLQFSPDDGKTWVDATEENFPAGGLTVTLPYPSGTGKDSHKFVVSHMFTTGNKAGTTETPAVTKTAEGIQFTVTGLSPVSVAWSAIPFDVSIAAVTNGTVYVSPAHTTAGTQVTITVTPKSGYKLSTLVVKDAAGNSYAISTDNNGKYYFTMPNANVTVTATFSKISTATADLTNPKTGDDFEVIFWSGMMMASLFSMAVLVLEKKKYYQR